MGSNNDLSKRVGAITCLILLLLTTAFPAKAEGAERYITSDRLFYTQAPDTAMVSIASLGTTDPFSNLIWAHTSATGSVIVGNALFPPNSDVHAFLHDETSGILDLGTLGGSWSQAYGLSADGTVIVGSSQLAGSAVYHAFRYDEKGGMQDLGTLAADPGKNSEAYGVSADGSVIVGGSRVDEDPFFHAFRYDDASGMVNIGALGGNSSYALDVSADGSVIVGRANLADNVQKHAFRYENGVMTDLGTFGGRISTANGISGDGRVVVGHSYLSDNETFRAFRHDDANGMMDLGTLGGSNSIAQAASFDGSIIVGYAQTTDPTPRAAPFEDVWFDIMGDTNFHAFRYDDTSGMIDLGTLGGSHSFATDISDDGSTIVGISYTENDTDMHVFIYRTTMIDLDNTYEAIALNATRLFELFNLQHNLLQRSLDSSHGPFGSQGLNLSIGGRYTTLGTATLDEGAACATVSYAFSPKLHAGLHLDQTFSQSVPATISLDHPQPLSALFFSWAERTNGTGPSLSASMAWQRLDADIERPNLSYTEAGRGETRLESSGARFEARWGIPLNAAWRLAPIAGMQTSRIWRAAYDERNDVDFPLHYDEFEQQTTSISTGMRISGPLTSSFQLRAMAILEHDIHTSQTHFLASNPTLGSFRLPPPDRRHNRVAAELGIDYLAAKLARINLTTAFRQQPLRNDEAITLSLSCSVGI